MQRTGFNQSVIDKLNYYVYCLVDPRNNRIFYIGKGHGNRVFQHALCAMTSTDETLKLQTIREIIQDGREVNNLPETPDYQGDYSLLCHRGIDPYRLADIP